MEVNVSRGGEVSVGDVLFTLAGTGSEELDAARDELDALLLDLERMVIRASLDGNYAAERRAIQLAREDISDAQRDLADLPFSEAEIAIAQAELDAAKAVVEVAKDRVDSAELLVESAQGIVDDRQTAVDAAQEYLDELGALQTPDTTEIDREIADVRAESTNKQIERDAAWIVHRDDYRALEAIAAQPPFNTTGTSWAGLTSSQRATFLAAAAMSISTPTSMIEAYHVITDLDDEISALETRLTRLQQDRNTELDADNSAEINRRRRRVDDAQAALTTANTSLTAAEREKVDADRALENAERAEEEADEELKRQQGYREDWQGANTDIRGLNRTLEDLLFALAEKQRTDGVENALSAVDMREHRYKVDKARDRIEELEDESTGRTVNALVSGVVTQINVSPGDTTAGDTPLAVIEVVDRGYYLSFTVTVEQARRLAVGDIGEVDFGWGAWGMGEVRAVLKSIRNDPQNPQLSRVLEFDISGEVESGAQLDLILGQRSEHFETIVPTNAIRSDTNGDFVLVLLERESPLGNRLIATRVDVNILAADDANTAVSGALTTWNFIITTSNRPIEPGTQVRLVANPS